MTEATATDEAPNSDLLKHELKILNDAPTWRRGDAAVRLATMTVAVLRRLEIRLIKLEAATNAQE